MALALKYEKQKNKMPFFVIFDLKLSKLEGFTIYNVVYVPEKKPTSLTVKTAKTRIPWPYDIVASISSIPKRKKKKKNRSIKTSKSGEV